MSFGEPVKRLAAQVVLNALPFELDRMRALLSHGLSPRKPGSVSRFSGSPSVHPKGCTPQDVRVVPLGDICSAANCSLFDHLVGTGEQRGRYVQAERLGSLEIDHQLVLG